MKKAILAISLLTCASISHAAANKLTHHSRNNCVNNESISWDGTKYHHLGVNSTHFYQDGSNHKFGSGIAHTWRSAAVHWGEGVGGWVAVAGEHYILYDDSNKIKTVLPTYVTDCDIYNGWWESEGPKGAN